MESKKNVLLTVPYPPGLVGGPFLVINYAQKQRESQFFVLLAYWLKQMPLKLSIQLKVTECSKMSKT